MRSDKLFSIDFCRPSTKEELLTFLGVQECILDKSINKSDFIKHRIPKKRKRHNEEYRTVWEVPRGLEGAYKTFARRFDLFLRSARKQYPHPCAYGYVRGRNIIENAALHSGKSLILHADIKDFFPSISAKRICKKFLELGIQEEVAQILTHFVTIDGILPLGLHTSPMLANLVCMDLDDKLSQLASRYDCSYTRYADDISISGHFKVPSKEEIKIILGEEGFLLSERKFRITKPGQAHYVTGLSVTDSNFPRAPRSMKKRLRQELYYCKKYGIVEHLSKVDGVDDFVRRGVNRLDGTIRYIAHIEKGALPTLREDWKALLTRDRLEPSYSSREERDIKYVFYIDESELEYAGKKVLALAIVIAQDGIVETETEKILRKYEIDPFTGGKKSELERERMHYNNANEDLRKTYINYLSVSEFKCYLAFGDLSSHNEYGSLYLSLLKSLLPHRFMGSDGAYISMVFEENSKVQPKLITQAVSEVYAKLERTNNRRPRPTYEVQICKKREACFAVPDFLLGVWGDYIKKHNDRGDRAKLHFESLRDKYRIILNTDRNICFSRKRPFLPEYWHNT